MRLDASVGDLLERHERAPQHHGMALVVDPPPPGPPGQLGVLPRREHLVVVARELGQLLDDHGARRHVDADGQRLGGEHRLDQPLDEAGLDRLLERRHHPGVVGGDAGLELGEELPVAEHGEVLVADPLQAGGDDLPDAVALFGRRQPHPSGRARPRRLLALVAAEDEHDRRQQPALLEQVDRLDPPRRVEHPPTAAPRRPLGAAAPRPPHRRRVEAHRVRVRPPALERLQEVQPVVRAVADQVAVVEVHRPAQLDHRRRRSPHRLDPGRQLGGVAHRRRQAHQLDVLGQVDDDLLPHRAAVGVLQEVDLVEHDEAERRRAASSRRRSCCAAPRSSSPRSGHRRRWRCRRSAARRCPARSVRAGRGTSGSTAP